MGNSSLHIFLRDPWLWYESIIYEHAYCTVPHQHAAWQLTASLAGTFYLQNREQVCRISPGQWILMAPGILHNAGSDDPSSEAIQIFFRRFPEDLLPEPARCFNFSRNIVLQGTADLSLFQEVDRNFRRIEEHRSELNQSLRTLYTLQFVLAALETADPGQCIRTKANPLILKSIRYMEEHCGEPLSASDFAEHAGLSISRFNDLFRQETGKSPMHFLNEIRISHAQASLLKGCSIKECARLNGFSSSQYFCKCFRQFTGRTPGDFQNNPFC